MLIELKKNLELTSRLSSYSFSGDVYKLIEENEKLIQRLVDLDKKINFDNISQPYEFEEILLECKKFQDIIDVNWKNSTDYIQKELNEIEVTNQIIKYLHKDKN